MASWYNKVMEKTTVRIFPSLKKQVNIYTATNDLTLQYVLNEALRKYLQDQKKRSLVKKGSWVDSLDALDLGVEKYLLTRENLYKRDEDII